jgi:hypothetical protein
MRYRVEDKIHLVIRKKSHYGQKTSFNSEHLYLLLSKCFFIKLSMEN